MTGNEHHQDGAQQRRPRVDHSLSTANIDLRGVAQRRREIGGGRDLEVAGTALDQPNDMARLFGERRLVSPARTGPAERDRV